MNCKRCQAELEDFLYGESSASSAAEIRAHLVSCLDCAAVRDELERENDIFAQYYERTALEPGDEMWDAIRSRITAEPRSSSPPQESPGGWLKGLMGAGVIAWLLRPAVLRQLIFAAVLIALSVGVTTLLLRNNRQNQGDLITRDGGIKTVATPLPSVTPTPTPEPAKSPGNETAKGREKGEGERPAPVNVRRIAPPSKPLSDQEMLNQQIARAEHEYQNAIKMLDRAISKRQDSLDPDLFKQYQSSLALIDDSIAKSRRALQERPSDLAAGQFLLAAYAKKVELMQDIAMR